MLLSWALSLRLSATMVMEFLFMDCLFTRSFMYVWALSKLSVLALNVISLDVS